MAGSKRIVGFDFAKTFAIFLVFTIHLCGSCAAFPRTGWANAFTILTVVCVPLFFMVNGALLLNKEMDYKKHLRRITHTVVLTIFWKLTTMAFCMCCYGSPEYEINTLSIVQFLLGGSAPYGALGYLWFLNAYIALLLFFFPIIKLVFDDQDQRPLVFLVGLLMIPVVSDTCFMMLQPLQTGRANSSIGLDSVFSYFGSYGVFTSTASQIIYFVIGGLVYRSMLNCCVTDEDGIKGCRKPGLVSIFAAIISYLVLLYINWWQRRYTGQQFDIAQKYTNIFTIILTTSLFVLFARHSYSKPIAKLSMFVGKRTFGVYAAEIVPMYFVTGVVNAAFDASVLGSVGAFLFYLLLYFGLVVCSAGVIALLEQIPYVRYFIKFG